MREEALLMWSLSVGCQPVSMKTQMKIIWHKLRNLMDKNAVNESSGNKFYETAFYQNLNFTKRQQILELKNLKTLNKKQNMGETSIICVF